MKKATLSVCMVIGLVAVLTTFTYGQGSEMYRANIPFDFSIGKKYFSAGEYSLEVKGFEQKLFIFRDADGDNAYALLSLATSRSMRDRQAVLEFQRTAGIYGLTAVRAANFAALMPKLRAAPNLGQYKEPKPVIVALRR
jgi:hypothetical protein